MHLQVHVECTCTLYMQQRLRTCTSVRVHMYVCTCTYTCRNTCTYTCMQQCRGLLDGAGTCMQSVLPCQFQAVLPLGSLFLCGDIFKQINLYNKMLLHVIAELLQVNVDLSVLTSEQRYSVCSPDVSYLCIQFLSSSLTVAAHYKPYSIFQVME